MNKHFIYGFITALTIIIIAGCVSLKDRNSTAPGKAEKAEAKLSAKMDAVDVKLNKSNVDKLQLIGEYSFGTGYSLNLVSNKEPAVVVADTLNQRIVALADQPSLEAMKEMRLLVANLISNNVAGIKELNQRDTEIVRLQNNITTLHNDKAKYINEYEVLAGNQARLVDQYKATLNDMDSWFGLGAIGYGVKKLTVSIIWFAVIGGVIYLVLRFASATSPVAASIFSVVERMVSWVINCCVSFAPKAISKAGYISTKVYNSTAGILTKIVDNIQNIKQLEAKTGQLITLKELLDELEKSLDVNEKDQIAKIKRDLGYN